jgi:hypothetical protein
MLAKELGYLATAPSPSSEEFRLRIVFWCYNIVDHLSLPRDIVSVTFSVLDRYYAATQGQLTKKTSEIAALSALYLAMKVSARCISPFPLPNSTNTLLL